MPIRLVLMCAAALICLRSIAAAPPTAEPTAPTKKDEKPPHIVEKTDMKGRMVSGMPFRADEPQTVPDTKVRMEASTGR